MRHLSLPDIRGPLVPGAGLILGAAGRRGGRARCPADPDLCRISSGLLSSAGGCPCGSIPRPL